MKSVSVRGDTYSRVKQRAEELGLSMAELVEQWVLQYAPFTDLLPKESGSIKGIPVRSKHISRGTPTGGGYTEF